MCGAIVGIDRERSSGDCRERFLFCVFLLTTLTDSMTDGVGIFFWLLDNRFAVSPGCYHSEGPWLNIDNLLQRQSIANLSDVECFYSDCKMLYEVLPYPSILI